MIENLKVNHFRNGEPILHVTSNNTWLNLFSGAYCVYENTPSHADTYGNLYNWYAVVDVRNIAPTGWHVPTDEEIMELEMYLGMSESETSRTGWRGTNEGSILAGRADLWTNGDLENNTEFGSSSFNTLPGGTHHGSSGTFHYMSTYCYLWSSTEDGNGGVGLRVLYYDDTTVYRSIDSGSKNYGFSIRCVKD